MDKSPNSGNESDDSAPESVSFGTSKMENTEKSQKIQKQINSIRESQKLKRIQRQEKYIEQKVCKLQTKKRHRRDNRYLYRTTTTHFDLLLEKEV